MITASTSSTLHGRRDARRRAPRTRALDHLRSASLSPCSSARAQIAARQARALALLHQLEEVGLAPLLDELARRALPSPRGPRRPPCSRAARTCSARRRARRRCGRSRRRRRARSTACRRGSARRRRRCPRRRRAASRYGLPGAELELGVGGDLHVVAERAPCSRAPSSSVARERERCLPSRAGCARSSTLPPSIVPGEPTPTPASVGGLDSAAARRVAQRRLHLGRDIRRAAARRRRPPRRAEHAVILVDDHGLDLRAAEVDAADGHRAIAARMHRRRARRPAARRRAAYCSAALLRVLDRRRAAAWRRPSARAARRCA